MPSCRAVLRDSAGVLPWKTTSYFSGRPSYFLVFIPFETLTMCAKKKSLRETVRETLLERIGSGELSPGERVMEATLAEQLGISSIPVREAIRELVAMGMLEYERNRGAWVRKVSLTETLDALKVRAAFESLAAQTAVGHLQGNCTRLRQVVRAIVTAARKRDFVAFQQHNQQFHRMIVEASGNGVLLRLWDSLAFEVRTRFVLEHLTSVDPLTLAKEHETIIEAIEQGQVKRAASLLKSHSRHLVRYLKQQARAKQKRKIPAPHARHHGKPTARRSPQRDLENV